MARLHQLQRQSRDVLVVGRLEGAPVDSPASRGVEPATASQRPDGGSPSNPGPVDLTAVKVAMDRRDFDLATALLDRVIDTHPDAPDALALMGLLLERRGLDHAAYHEYRKALAVDPDNVNAQASMRRYCAGSASMPTTLGSTRLPDDDPRSRHPHPFDDPMDTTPLTSSAAQAPAATGHSAKTARIPAPGASSNTSVDQTEGAQEDRKRNNVKEGEGGIVTWTSTRLVGVVLL